MTTANWVQGLARGKLVWTLFLEKDFCWDFEELVDFRITEKKVSLGRMAKINVKGKCDVFWVEWYSNNLKTIVKAWDEYFGRRLKTSRRSEEMNAGVDISMMSVWAEKDTGTALSEVLISWHWLTLKEVTSPWTVIDETGYGHFWCGVSFSVRKSGKGWSCTIFFILIKPSHVDWGNSRVELGSKKSAIYLHVHRPIYIHTYSSHTTIINSTIDAPITDTLEWDTLQC